MSSKLKIKHALLILAVSLILFYILSRILLVVFLNAALKNLSTEKISVLFLTARKREFFLFYYVIDTLPLFIGVIFAIIIFKKLMPKFHNRRENIKLNNTISELQTEIERQNRQINNLSNLYSDAVEYNRIKTEFFANISHELKTPLSVILGAIQLIDHKNSCILNDKKNLSKHFKTIKQNSYRLVRLINNILDITRIDSGYIKINLVNCNIVYLIEEMTQSIASYAEQKGLILEFDTEFEEIVTAVDIDKIERIILNLLSNAIKFTPVGGKISVTINGRNEKIFISVKDTGPGIPEYMQSIVFERFKQVNNTFTRESEGTGIGLSLVKSFVELHDGNITINSEEGRGCEFLIEIPVKLSEESICPGLNHSNQTKIIEAINIEFSDIYTVA
ncbi:MAG: HAMP domain-containing histidine kinase [Clostridia bacterium]|nr:HAMP domain-containing histidine kinase [Clostridia bacterium]